MEVVWKRQKTRRIKVSFHREKPFQPGAPDGNQMEENNRVYPVSSGKLPPHSPNSRWCKLPEQAAWEGEWSFYKRHSLQHECKSTLLEFYCHCLTGFVCNAVLTNSALRGFNCVCAFEEIILVSQCLPDSCSLFVFLSWESIKPLNYSSSILQNRTKLQIKCKTYLATLFHVNDATRNRLLSNNKMFL